MAKIIKGYSRCPNCGKSWEKVGYPYYGLGHVPYCSESCYMERKYPPLEEETETERIKREREEAAWIRWMRGG